MTTKTIKILVFAALLVHGIGHLQGVVSSLGVKFRDSGSNVSWLLKGMGEHINHMICLILYLGAAIFGILTALCFKEWLCIGNSWQSMALITAIISTFCLVLFPNALAMFFNKAGAIAVNLIIYYSILLNHQWPTAAFED
jgi:hypothetical protein